METVRSFLLQQVELGTSTVVSLQKRRARHLDICFQLASAAGDKTFYIVLVPLFLWIICPIYDLDERIIRQMLYLLCLGTFLGNFLKDWLALPRPPSPPVWKQKKQYDYGLPSTHTLNAVSIGCYTASVIIKLRGLGSQEIAMISLVVVWSFTVLLSRIYAGLHSPADAFCGVFLGLLVCSPWIAAGWVTMDNYLASGSNAVIIAVFATLCLLLIHPRVSRNGNPAFRRNVQLLGVYAGCTVGTQLHGNHLRAEHLATFFSTFFAIPRLVLLFKQSPFWTLFLPKTWDVVIRTILGFFVLNSVFLLTIIGTSSFLVVLISTCPFIMKITRAFDVVVKPISLRSFENVEDYSACLHHPKNHSVSKKDSRWETDEFNTELPQRRRGKSLKYESAPIVRFVAGLAVAVALTHVIPCLLNAIQRIII